MSAFIVSKAHIDALVAVALFGPTGCRAANWRGPCFGDPARQATYCIASEIGEMLVKENLSSIHSRYPDTAVNPRVTPGPVEQYWLEPYTFPFDTRTFYFHPDELAHFFPTEILAWLRARPAPARNARDEAADAEAAAQGCFPLPAHNSLRR